MRVTIEGLADPVIPEGPVAVMVTVPLKLLTPVRVTWVVPEVPREMVRLVGLSAELNPAAPTCSAMWTE